MEKMKKVLALSFVFWFVANLPAVFGQNASEFYGTWVNGGMQIRGYTGQAKDVIIPERLDGIPVTSIGRHALRYRQLTSVIIPDSVESIGFEAFAGNELISVTLGNSINVIGEEAFRSNRLTSIEIPDSVDRILRSAFRNNQLSNVVIPDSVSLIETGAFLYNQLTSVIVPRNTKINPDAFDENVTIIRR